MAPAAPLGRHAVIARVQQRALPIDFGSPHPCISILWQDAHLPEALAVSGHSRAEHEAFDDPAAVMSAFAAWVREHGGKRPIFISDNNGFDWSFINYYFHRFTGGNPFGHSSQNLGSLYKGVVKDTFATFKHLRKTAHTHHPVDDAKGNAEALLAIHRDLGLKLSL